MVTMCIYENVNQEVMGNVHNTYTHAVFHYKYIKLSHNTQMYISIKVTCAGCTNPSHKMRFRTVRLLKRTCICVVKKDEKMFGKNV